MSADAFGGDAEVVILATPAGTHVRAAQRLVGEGRSVISVSDHPDDVQGLLDLDAQARSTGCSVVVGAGFAPGMSCLLARHAASLLDSVESVAVAKSGTGGPACAREHHRALKTAGVEYRSGAWISRAGGSGRELVWFPDPVGALDCYRGDLPSPKLLYRIFPDADRITARVSATRRDRLTSRLPMMRQPHPDGGPGAIRVEVRGLRGGAVETVVYGVMDHPSVATGTVAAVSAIEVGTGGFPHGAFGLGELESPVPMLRTLHDRGIRAATYDGPGFG
jgi:saccharopine dehydrogenase-like NADP-dependent oxidoreductase